MSSELNIVVLNASTEILDRRLPWPPFRSINIFLLALASLSLLQGMIVNGLTNATVISIQREFGFSGAQSGAIVASNDISGLLIVLVVSYYGDRQRKPLWIGLGGIITGIGCLMFALPKLLKGIYEPNIPTGAIDLSVCNVSLNSSAIPTPASGESGQGSSSLYLFLFCLAQIVMGAGTTPLYTLGASYLDENVAPKSSPLYIGAWFFTTFLGPGVGFLIAGRLLSIYVDNIVPVGMTPFNPLWVGRWWLGYVACSAIFCLLGAVLAGFPKEIPGAAEIRKKAEDEGDLKVDAIPSIQETSFKNLLVSTLLLVRNPTLVLACLAVAAQILAAVGSGPFLTTMLIQKYGADGQKANMLVGGTLLISTAIGIAIGSILMRKVSVKGSVSKAIAICIVISFSTFLASFNYLQPGCEKPHIAGINDGNTLRMPCNSNCSCSSKMYIPTCDRSSGITYYSPCFAGCSDRMANNTYGNCTCASSVRPTATPHVNANKKTLHAGKCSQNCKNLALFTAGLLITIILGYVSGTPQNMIVIRCVPFEQRSIALGFQFVILRGLSFLPGPVLIGSVIDSTCLVWRYDASGAKGFCAEYDVDKLSMKILTAFSCCGAATTSLYAIAYLVSRRQERKQKEGGEISNSSMQMSDG